jgi:hypothetical protein
MQRISVPSSSVNFRRLSVANLEWCRLIHTQLSCVCIFSVYRVLYYWDYISQPFSSRYLVCVYLWLLAYWGISCLVTNGRCWCSRSGYICYMLSIWCNFMTLGQLYIPSTCEFPRTGGMLLALSIANPVVKPRTLETTFHATWFSVLQIYYPSLISFVLVASWSENPLPLPGSGCVSSFYSWIWLRRLRSLIWGQEFSPIVCP